MPDTPPNDAPSQLPTDLSRWAMQPFESRAEENAAFASPRYSDQADEAFRTAVANKLAITSYPDEPRVSQVERTVSTRPNTIVTGEIRLTDEEVRGVQQHFEAQEQERQRQEALQAQERQIAKDLMIPTGPPIDRTKPPEPFKSIAEQTRHIADPRYSKDPSFREYVEARIIASEF